MFSTSRCKEHGLKLMLLSKLTLIMGFVIVRVMRNSLLKICIMLLTIYAFSSYILAYDNGVERQSENTVNQVQMASSYNQYLSRLDQVKSEIHKNRLTAAIDILNGLVSSLRLSQAKVIATFFPDAIGDYWLEKNNRQFDELDVSVGSYGVLYSARYKHKDGPTIDVNVILDDAVIEEYVSIINAPQLVKQIKNTAIITVDGGYSAIEKVIESDFFCERNIVISKALLVNVIANGVSENTFLDQFSSEIDFSRLENYLLP